VKNVSQDILNVIFSDILLCAVYMGYLIERKKYFISTITVIIKFDLGKFSIPTI